jgi:DedD protein
MEEGAKRRLAGAAVIVVLLVVFLPMLLEDEPGGPVPEGDLKIPPRPEFDSGYDAPAPSGPAEIAVHGLEASPDEPPAPQDLPQELAPPPLFDAPAAPDAAYEPEPEQEPTSIVVDEPAPVVVEEPPAGEAQPPAQEPPPAPKPIPAGLSSWIIQVASLTEQGRAKALEQELRAKGFPAFIEQAEVNQKLYHRVRVGPEIDRKRIESMAVSLKAKTGHEGQIQRYR